MVDVLAFGPHPDDVELGIGGTLLKLRQKGYTVGIIDLSRGELSTNGSVEERSREAEAVALRLGALRENLELPDGGLVDTPPYRRVLVEVLRRHRPSLVFYPISFQDHPDHTGASQLISAALYLSGIRRYGRDSPHRPAESLGYAHTLFSEPDLVVDVTSVYEEKLHLILTHSSQFTGEDGGRSPTRINQPLFLQKIRSRDQYFGSLVGVLFGEGFFCRTPLLVDHPMEIVKRGETK